MLSLWLAGWGPPGAAQEASPSAAENASSAEASPSAAASASSSPAPTPLLERTPEPSIAEQIEWMQPSSTLDGEVTVVAHTESVWTTLGANGAWYSADGLTWSRGTVGPVNVDPPSDPGLAWEPPVFIGVAELQGTLYALARWHGTADSLVPLIFSSSDGKRWTQLPSDGWWGYSPTGIASDGRRLIVTNRSFGEGTGSVFESPDGVSWTEHRLGDLGAGMTSVYADADGVVAVGYRLADDTGQTPAVWISSSPSSWEEVPMAGVPERTTPQAVTRAPSGEYVMLTSTVLPRSTPCSVEDPCQPDEIRAWSSADGQAWTGQSLLGQSGSSGYQPPWGLAAWSNGVIALVPGATGVSGWTSRELSTWAVADLLEEIRTSSVVALAAHGSRVVVVTWAEGGSTLLVGDIE